MNIEDMLAYVILAAITVGMLYFLTGKFVELKVIKEELVQSRDTIDMLQFLLTSSDLLVTENGRKMRLMLNNTYLQNRDDVRKVLEESTRPNFVDYNYRLEIFSDASLEQKLYDFNFVDFDLDTDCYLERGVYSPVTRDSPALLCYGTSNYFCNPVVVRLTSVPTPISQLVSWISKLCYQNASFEKHIVLNVSEVVECTGDTIPNCGIKIDLEKNLVCFHLTGKKVCKGYYCDKPIGIVSELVEEECTRLVVNRTNEKIFVQGPHVWR